MRIEKQSKYIALRWREVSPGLPKSTVAIVWNGRKSGITKTEASLVIAVNLILFAIVYIWIE